MSVKYQPVQWNRFKNRYNAVVLAMVFAYLGIFLGVGNDLAGHALNPDGAIHTARAFGSCAFLMLTVILCIGPLARLDQRFLPLLYNRRHFGVLTFVVALTHVMAVSNWYFAFSPTPMLEAMLSSNVSYRQYLGFPFEALGMFALLSLAALAFTSHDFWLKFLTPPIWKAIHFSIYPAYAALVGHVALGALQDETNTAFAIAVVISAFTVCALHALAAFVEVKRGVVAAGAAGDYADWQVVGSPAEIAEGEAKVICLASGGRAAIFRHEGAFSAISNACAHQNGPLGEGRILKGCVTCPWHGFQYDVRNGRSPAPFTEMIPTYNLALHEGQLLIDPTPNPPGTPTEAIPAPEVAS